MIRLAEHEWAAVNAPVFQRLRWIKQLAMTNLVYPGAVHTRFEHSIGTRHVAGRLCERLGLEPEECEIVCAAALLHDVGHGPFSHVSEQVIDELAGVHGVHEAVSAWLIRNDKDIRAALGGELAEAAAALVALEGPRSAARDIVSGPTDADKLDYLLRDSYFAGVKYGEYDLGRIIDSARIIGPNDASSQLGFDADGLWAVEGLLMARHHMHRQVYGHKTRIATDIMTTRALRLGIVEEVLDPAAYRVATKDRKPAVDEDFIRGYVQQTDALVLHRLCGAPEGPVRDLAERLRDRRLLRQTELLRLNERRQDLGAPRFAELIDADETGPAVIADMEEQIAKEIGVPAHLVAIYVDARTNPTFRNPDAQIRPKDVMIQRGDQPPQLLQYESEVFRQEILGEDQVWVHLYTPDLEEPDRDRARKELWSTLSGQ